MLTSSSSYWQCTHLSFSRFVCSNMTTSFLSCHMTGPVFQCELWVQTARARHRHEPYAIYFWISSSVQVCQSVFLHSTWWPSPWSATAPFATHWPPGHGRPNPTPPRSSLPPGWRPSSWCCLTQFLAPSSPSPGATTARDTCAAWCGPPMSSSSPGEMKISALGGVVALPSQQGVFTLRLCSSYSSPLPISHGPFIDFLSLTLQVRDDHMGESTDQTLQNKSMPFKTIMDRPNKVNLTDGGYL